MQAREQLSLYYLLLCLLCADVSIPDKLRNKQHHARHTSARQKPPALNRTTHSQQQLLLLYRDHDEALCSRDNLPYRFSFVRRPLPLAKVSRALQVELHLVVARIVVIASKSVFDFIFVDSLLAAEKHTILWIYLARCDCKYSKWFGANQRANLLGYRAAWYPYNA